MYMMNRITYNLIIIFLFFVLVTLYVYASPSYKESFDYLKIKDFESKYKTLIMNTQDGKLNESNIQLFIDQAIELDKEANGFLYELGEELQKLLSNENTTQGSVTTLQNKNGILE